MAIELDLNSFILVIGYYLLVNTYILVLLVNGYFLVIAFWLLLISKYLYFSLN